VEVTPPPSETLVARLASEINLPLPVVRLLVNRGYQTRDEVVSFLKPEFSDLHDPFLMKDMEKSVDRLLCALDSGELITLWGDYDVDGITGIALLHRILESLGARLRFYIPHRQNEGYGLSEKGITDAAKAGSTLIVTVDCGVNAMKEIKLGAEHGIDTIVTDHHLPPASLPPAFAILDPKLARECYPFTELSGVGVAFKLVHAVWEKKKLDVERLKGELDLVALGTVADIVPLIGENRIFSRIGLWKLNRTEREGLKALVKVGGLSGKRIDARHILFALAPRLNASGRMSEARKAVEMLISEDEETAMKLSMELNSYNSQRKSVEEKILLEAISMVEEADLGKDPVIVLAQDGWHPGVIGICASRIADKYWRPTVLVAFEGNQGKGSARSIPSFNIYEALNVCSEYLDDFGGHSQAAGLQMAKEKFDRLRERLKQVAAKKLTEEDLTPKTVVDSELSFDEIDEKLVKVISLFAPHGHSNPVPLFLTRGVEAVGTPKLVGTNHLKTKLRHDGKVHSAIGFSLGELVHRIEIAKPELGVVYSVGEDDFTGVRKIVLNVKRVCFEESCRRENRGDPI
jgi:single-stranded-DNA-specific exonuclease